MLDLQKCGSTALGIVNDLLNPLLREQVTVAFNPPQTFRLPRRHRAMCAVIGSSMTDAKRPPRGEGDCGRGSQGLGIDLGRKLLVIHARRRRERERSDEEGSGEAER